MPEHKHMKRSLLKGQGGKNKRGRSKKKWLETVTADGRKPIGGGSHRRNVNWRNMLKKSYNDMDNVL
jgi:hypothetical protein